MSARPPRRTKRAGFTLVESVVSAGIISSALLTVLGLLSSSMTTARDTRHQAAANILAEQLANRIIHTAAAPAGGEVVEIYDLSLNRVDSGTSEALYSTGTNMPQAMFLCRAILDEDSPLALTTTGRRLIVTVEHPASAPAGNRQIHRYVSRAPF